MNGERDELAPIDILVIGYPPGAPMRGDAVPILLDLVDRRVIRVLDAMLVRREPDGSFAGLDLGVLDPAYAGDLTALAGASTGLLDDADAAQVAAELEPGAAAVMLVYENRWAAPFVDAVRRNGGEIIASQRVGVQELLAALDAADANT